MALNMYAFLQPRDPKADCGLPWTQQQERPGRSLRVGLACAGHGWEGAGLPSGACALGVSFMRVSTLFEFCIMTVNLGLGKVCIGKIFFKKMRESHYQVAH